MDLLTDTYKLIATSNLSIRKIAKGSDVGERWLHKLIKGLWQDPGVRKVNRIYLFLKTGEVQQESQKNGSTDAAGDSLEAATRHGAPVPAQIEHGGVEHGVNPTNVGQ